MCGRYVRRSDKQKIAEFFHANPKPAELPVPGADYNIAPTTFQRIIRQSRDRASERWSWPGGVWYRSSPRI